MKFLTTITLLFLFVFSIKSQSSFFVDDAENVYKCGPDWVKKYAPGDTVGLIVAGGNGQGGNANQLKNPSAVIVDEKGDVFICDTENHRIQKWEKGAKAGITVAGGNGAGSAANQLDFPNSFVFDSKGNIIIHDLNNHRIQSWKIDKKEGVSVLDMNISFKNESYFLNNFTLINDNLIYISLIKTSQYQQWNGKVIKWDIEKQISSDYVPTNLTEEQYQNFFPSEIFVDKKGNLFTKSSQIWNVIKISPNSTKGQVLVSDLYGVSISLDKKGNLWLFDTVKDEIYKYEEKSKEPILGQFLNAETVIVGKESFIEQPTNVFLTENKRIYVEELLPNFRLTRFEKGEKIGKNMSNVKLNNAAGAYPRVQVKRNEDIYLINPDFGWLKKYISETDTGSIVAGDYKRINENFPYSELFWISSNGDIYLEDAFYKNQIQKWNEGSKKGSVVAETKDIDVEALYLDRDSTIYVFGVDKKNHYFGKVFQKYNQIDKTWTILWSDKDNYNSTYKYSFINQINSDSDNNIFTLDYNKILKWKPNSTIPEYVFGQQIGTNSKLNSPQGFTIAPNGDIYIADTGNNRILKVNPHVKIAEKSVSQKTLTEYNGAYFLTQTNELIAKIIPDESNLAMGEVTASVAVDDVQDPSFVKRHYKIETNNPTHKSKIALYFTQAEFDAYNLLNDKKLPSKATDITGIANIIITSAKIKSGRRTLPLQTTIEIPDNQIVWNENLNVWEISFEDTGSKEYWLKTKFEFKKSNSPRPPRPFETQKYARQGVENEMFFENDLEIFPNPAHNSITLQIFDNELIGTKASINNEIGLEQKSFRITKNREEIDIEKLPIGLYFIQFKNGKTAKFLKRE